MFQWLRLGVGIYPVHMVRRAFRFGVACALGLLLSGCDPAKKDPKAVKEQLAQVVPLQSTETQVLAYMDREKIDHSAYHRDEKLVDASKGATLGNTIEATWTMKVRRGIVNPCFDVVFRFNDQDRLIGYDVDWLGYVGF